MRVCLGALAIVWAMGNAWLAGRRVSSAQTCRSGCSVVSGNDLSHYVMCPAFRASVSAGRAQRPVWAIKGHMWLILQVLPVTASQTVVAGGWTYLVFSAARASGVPVQKDELRAVVRASVRSVTARRATCCIAFFGSEIELAEPAGGGDSASSCCFGRPCRTDGRGRGRCSSLRTPPCLLTSRAIGLRAQVELRLCRCLGQN